MTCGNLGSYGKMHCRLLDPDMVDTTIKYKTDYCRIFAVQNFDIGFFHAGKKGLKNCMLYQGHLRLHFNILHSCSTLKNSSLCFCETLRNKSRKPSESWLNNSVCSLAFGWSCDTSDHNVYTTPDILTTPWISPCISTRTHSMCISCTMVMANSHNIVYLKNCNGGFGVIAFLPGFD